jgi:5-formyltetrahydrofolate cyclo-ligase
VAQETKAFIRKKILNLLNKQEEEDKRKKSLIILDKIFNFPEFRRSNTVLFYASFDGEVETFEMMKQAQQLGKKIALPIAIRKERKIVPMLVDNLEEDLECGEYGIMQPKETAGKTADLNELDMVVVPGLAFDKNNTRLGRGAGYYDRFLEKIPSNVFSVGLAFDFQIVDFLPKEANDIAVSSVISN